MGSGTSRSTSTRVAMGVMAVGLTVLFGAPGSANGPPEVVPALPPGVSATLYRASVPPDRAPTAAAIALGEKLFNDKRLSRDDSVACATCHDPKLGFVDGKTVSVGIGQQKGQRNSPTVLNALFNAAQFWDGRAGTLEDQAKLPILNPIEMGMKDGAQVVAKLRAIPEYDKAFRDTFGHEIRYDDLAAAIAAFERTQFSGDAPFDAYIAGETEAISPAARRGWAVFNGKGRCNSCHAANRVSPLFSDAKFHNIGIAAQKQDFVSLAREAIGVVRAADPKEIDELAVQSKFSELGRFLVSKQENDIGSFKTPTLRNIAITGPYMHDGSIVTLWDVIDHYNKGGVPNPYLDGGMQRLGLSEAEIDDLVTFLFTLTDKKFAALGAKELARQTKQKTTRPQRDTQTAFGQKGHLGDLAPNPDARKSPASIGVY